MASTAKASFYQFDQSILSDEHSTAIGSNYHLSIFLGEQTFQFAVFHIADKRYLGIADYSFQLENGELPIDLFQQIYRDDEWLKLNYRSVNVAFINQKSSLIPSAIFEENELEHYLRLNLEILKEEQLMYDKLLLSNLSNCFAVNQNWIEKVKNIYPNATFQHFSSSFIESSVQYPATASIACVNFDNNQFEVLVKKNQELLFYNSFSYQTAEDVIYFIMYVFEQLELSNIETPLVLSGKIEKDSTIYQLLYKYIKEVDFIKIADNVAFALPLERKNLYRYNNLIQQYLCV